MMWTAPPGETRCEGTLFDGMTGHRSQPTSSYECELAMVGEKSCEETWTG